MQIQNTQSQPNFKATILTGLQKDSARAKVIGELPDKGYLWGKTLLGKDALCIPTQLGSKEETNLTAKLRHLCGNGVKIKNSPAEIALKLINRLNFRLGEPAAPKALAEFKNLPY